MKRTKEGKWVSDCLRKTRYPTKAIARKVASRAFDERKALLRVYYYSHCNGYHLTHKVDWK